MQQLIIVEEPPRDEPSRTEPARSSSGNNGEDSQLNAGSFSSITLTTILIACLHFWHFNKVFNNPILKLSNYIFEHNG